MIKQNVCFHFHHRCGTIVSLETHPLWLSQHCSRTKSQDLRALASICLKPLGQNPRIAYNLSHRVKSYCKKCIRFFFSSVRGKKVSYCRFWFDLMFKVHLTAKNFSPTEKKRKNFHILASITAKKILIWLNLRFFRPR